MKLSTFRSAASSRGSRPSIRENLKKYWQRLRQARPGERFQELYKQRQNTRRTLWPRLLFVGLGLLLVIIGFILMFVPGPGSVIALLGAAMLAQESRFVARLLDRAEVTLWQCLAWAKRYWASSSQVTRVLLSLVAASMIAVGVALMYRYIESTWF